MRSPPCRIEGTLIALPLTSGAAALGLVGRRIGCQTVPVSRRVWFRAEAARSLVMLDDLLWCLVQGVLWIGGDLEYTLMLPVFCLTLCIEVQAKGTSKQVSVFTQVLTTIITSQECAAYGRMSGEFGHAS